MPPADAAAPASRPHRAVEALYYVTALFFFVYLLVYYWTGEGGPALLAFALVPVTFILFTLEALRKKEFYPRLPDAAQHAVAAVYGVICMAVAVYMVTEYEAIGTVRAGVWNTTDLVVGAVMVALIMEYARQRYFELFVLNILLLLYAVYGAGVPGMFNHPGLTWERVVTAMSVEMSTGVYSNLPQLALTLIGSFVLVLAALRAFGCVDSILRASKQIAVRSPHALPQSAVVGSMAVGTVSGSGAANAITVGSATIPAMIGAGMPRVVAAGIETASSLGGQLMPPVMGIAAFLMAEFLGRSYFDVVARGYAPALIYYAGVSLSVYLLSTRYQARLVVTSPEPMKWPDWSNLVAFAGVVGGLIILMATLHLAPMFAALYIFIAIVVFLAVAYGAALWQTRSVSWRSAAAPAGRLVDYFASMTSDLTLLLATLSIMTGAFVITGVPTKVGALLIEAAGVNIAAMAMVAFFFGALLGTGLPPAPTYIITALVIAPPMIKVGVDPWVVHFFAFFLAGLGRADATDVRRGRHHGEDRGCAVHADTVPGNPDLLFPVRADGRGLYAPRAGARARRRPAWRHGADPGRDSRGDLRDPGPVFGQPRYRPGAADSAGRHGDDRAAPPGTGRRVVELRPARRAGGLLGAEAAQRPGRNARPRRLTA